MKKTAVITGGSKGIGRSTVLEFVKNGFNIITCSRSKKDLKILEKEVNNIDQNVKIFYLDVDLSKQDDAVKFSKFVSSNTSHIDVLVNNVGTFVPGQLINEDVNALKFMIDTNLYSNYWV